MQNRFKSIIAALGTMSAFTASLLIGLQGTGTIPQATAKQNMLVNASIAILNIVIGVVAAYNNPTDKNNF